MILSATVSTNNLPDKTLTFLPFCQMFGPAAAAVVPLIPGDMDESCCQSKAIQNPSGTIDRHQKGLWKGTRPFTGHCQQITHTNQWTYCTWVHVWRFPLFLLLVYVCKHHSYDLAESFGFASAVVQHLWLCDHIEIKHLCLFSYIIIQCWTSELVPAFLPYAASDLGVWWCSRPAGAWWWTSNPSSHSDRLYARRRRGGVLWGGDGDGGSRGQQRDHLSWHDAILPTSRVWP